VNTKELLLSEPDAPTHVLAVMLMLDDTPLHFNLIPYLLKAPDDELRYLAGSRWYSEGPVQNRRILRACGYSSDQPPDIVIDGANAMDWIEHHRPELYQVIWDEFGHPEPDEWKDYLL
jgi:hypothetical protein